MYQILTNGEVSAILAVKLFVVILAICANYSFGGEYKYSCSEKKNIQKFAIISCLLAVGMLGTSTNNLLIANMFLDTSSMLFAGLVIFGANFYEIEADRSYKIAFNYLVASAITSVCSYTGSALILLSTGTYNMQAAAVNITQSTSANGHLLFNAGVVL